MSKVASEPEDAQSYFIVRASCVAVNDSHYGTIETPNKAARNAANVFLMKKDKVVVRRTNAVSVRRNNAGLIANIESAKRPQLAARA